MNRKIFITILLFSIIMISSFCNNSGSSLVHSETDNTIEKDIPIDKNGKFVRSYDYKNRRVDKLQLDSLEKGFDSIQIRIWLGYAFSDSAQLVVIENKHSQWSADLFTLMWWLDTSRENIDSVHSHVKRVRPVSGWSAFTKELFNLQVANLPDIDKLILNKPTLETDGVVVEVATKTTYRFYHYLKPSLLQNEFPEAEKMEQILKLLEKELNFKRYSEKGRNTSNPLPIVPKKLY